MREHAFLEQAARYVSHKSIEFDGLIDWVAVPNVFGIDTFIIRRSQASSVSFWVKNTKSSTTGDGQYLLSRWFPTFGGGISINEGGWRIFLRNWTSPAVTRSLTVNFCTHGLSGFWIYSLSSFPLNSWVHVLISYDGSGGASGCNMYWNGVLQSTHTLFSGWFSEAINSNAYSHLMMGSWYTNWPGGVYTGGAPIITGWMEGMMDEVSLWRYALDATEALQLYNCGYPIHPMHVGRPNGRTCSSHLRMGEYTDNQVLVAGVINLVQARYPVGGVYRPAWINNPVPDRILEDVSP